MQRYRQYNGFLEIQRSMEKMKSFKKKRYCTKYNSNLKKTHYSTLLRENRTEYNEIKAQDEIMVNKVTETRILEEDINEAKNIKAPRPGNMKMKLVKYGIRNLKLLI